MPSASPLLSLPVELLLSIRHPTWKALFAAYGFPPRLDAGSFARTTSAEVIDALGDPELPLSLLRALFALFAFASEAARVDTYAAAHALGHAVPWADAASPCDLAASMLAAAASDRKAQEILEVALVLRNRAFRPIPTQIYVGARGGDADLGELARYEEHWRRELAAWCVERGFGDVVSIAPRVHDAAVAFAITHEDRVTTYVERDKASSTLVARTVRPVRSHSVLYDSRSRGLAISTDCFEAMTPLARLAGTVLFRDPRYFLSEAAVDLWTLQELGREALVVPALADRVLAMSAIGGTWHSGKDHAMTPRGRDFFEALERYKIRIEGGRLEFVTLRAKVSAKDGGPEGCDVALRPPHLFTVSEPELVSLMRDFLDRAHVTRPRARVRDFFSLQPWIDTRALWVGYEGQPGFADLVARGILRADAKNRSVAPPDLPYAGRVSTAYRLSSGKLLAWSPDPTIAPFVTREEDLVVYALSFERLAAKVAEELGLDGAATALDDDGVLYCGRRALGPTHVLVFVLTRPVRPATIERLREAAGHGHAVLVTPEGRIDKNGLRQLPMPKLSASWRPLLGAIVRAFKLEPLVETTLYAPPDARLVLHRATKRVWLDGVACTKVSEMSFKLLDFLVAQGETPVHTRDIAMHLRGRHWHDDTTRKAIEALVHGIEASFKIQKKKLPKDFRSFLAKPKHGQYVLEIRAFAD